MKFNLFSTAAALIAAAALTWLVLRFFFGEQKAASGAMDVSGKRQTATITVKGGYSPCRGEYARGHTDHTDIRPAGDR